MKHLHHYLCINFIFFPYYSHCLGPGLYQAYERTLRYPSYESTIKSPIAQLSKHSKFIIHFSARISRCLVDDPTVDSPRKVNSSFATKIHPDPTALYIFIGFPKETRVLRYEIFDRGKHQFTLGNQVMAGLKVRKFETSQQCRT